MPIRYVTLRPGYQIVRSRRRRPLRNAARPMMPVRANPALRPRHRQSERT
ncbi:hypothetical protein FLP41_03190 (plasmid) [Paracoccus marcusii]|nr:hypothetical protein FLP41_03190 [Paracoccus marcusii]